MTRKGNHFFGEFCTICENFINFAKYIAHKIAQDARQTIRRNL